MRTTRLRTSTLSFSLGLLLICGLAACSAGGTSSTGQTSSGGQNGSATATATTSAPPTCQSLAGFGSAITATAGSGFSDVAFPANSISTAIQTSGGGTARYTIEQFDVCTPSSSVNAVHSFMASGLPGNGWQQVPTFPYDSARQDSCGDPYCWHKGGTPRFVSLEKVTDMGNGIVAYHMRLAIPPTPPTCVPDPIGIYPSRSYDIALPDTLNVPAPPLTKDGIGDGSQQGNVTRGGYSGMCSAGDGASINNFFTTELPKLGWQHSTPSSSLSGACQVSGVQWWKGSDIFSWNTFNSAGASGTFWSFGDCHIS